MCSILKKLGEIRDNIFRLSDDGICIDNHTLSRFCMLREILGKQPSKTDILNALSKDPDDKTKLREAYSSSPTLREVQSQALDSCSHSVPNTVDLKCSSKNIYSSVHIISPEVTDTEVVGTVVPASTVGLTLPQYLDNCVKIKWLLLFLVLLSLLSALMYCLKMRLRQSRRNQTQSCRPR